MGSEQEQNSSLTNIPAVLTGPAIAGEVKVSLSDLDKMRSEHVKAIKVAQQLAENQMSVKVVVVEEVGPIADKSKPGRIVNDGRYRELSVTYRNMDNFRNIIAEEIRDGLQDQIEAAKKVAEDASKSEADMRTKLSQKGIDYNTLKGEFNALGTEKAEVERKLVVEQIDSNAQKAKIQQQGKHIETLKELHEANKKTYEGRIKDLEDKAKLKEIEFQSVLHSKFGFLAKIWNRK